MSEPDTRTALEALHRAQADYELSIVKLSEPITGSASQEPRQRNSDASNASLDGPSPASLEADLAHYKELFAKLRFSYVEQVTKEKFIRAIVGDPPLIVTMQENLDLEKENGEAKAQLKSLKLEVDNMVTKLEEVSRELSRRFERVQLEAAQLAELPAKIEEIEANLAKLKKMAGHGAADPNMNLPLTKTQALVAKRKAEQQELARELESLRAKAPRKAKEAERLKAELQPLEAKSHNSAAAAREAQRRKEAALGGMADDLEQRARWWRASETVLRQSLDLHD